MRLHASGVCHSDQNAIDGTAETRCPAVLGHEGAGVVEAIGPGVTRRRSRRPGRALVAAGVRSVRAVPPRPAASVRGRVPRDGRRRASGRDDAPVAYDGPPGLPLLAALDVRRAHGGARGVVHPHRCGRAVRCRRPGRLRRHDRRVRRLAHRPGRARRSRRRVRLRRRRPLGRDGRGRRRSRARGGRRCQPRAGPGGGRVRRRRRRWPGPATPRRPPRPCASGVGRRRRPRVRGDRPSRGDAGGVPVDPPAGAGGADGHPPRRRRAARARAADPARRAARDRRALRLVAARARLPPDPRRLPPRPAAARPADLPPAAAGQIEDAFALLRGRWRPPRRARAGAGRQERRREDRLASRRARTGSSSTRRFAPPGTRSRATHQDATLVLVTADDGVRGCASGDALPDAALLERLLRGVDPFRTEVVREVCETVDFHGGRPWTLEVAVWDLVGRALGRAAVAAARRPQRVAARLRVERRADAPADERARRCVALRDAGVRAVKLRFHDDDWRRDVEVVEAVRDAVGRGDADHGRREPGLADARRPHAALGRRDRASRAPGRSSRSGSSGWRSRCGPTTSTATRPCGGGRRCGWRPARWCARPARRAIWSCAAAST